MSTRIYAKKLLLHPARETILQDFTMRTLLEILLLGSPLFCWANDLGPIPSEYMAFDEDQGSGICLSQEVEDQFCLGIPELGHFKRQAEAKCAWEALPAQPCLEEEGNLVGNNRKRSK